MRRWLATLTLCAGAPPFVMQDLDLRSEVVLDVVGGAAPDGPLETAELSAGVRVYEGVVVVASLPFVFGPGVDGGLGNVELGARIGAPVTKRRGERRRLGASVVVGLPTASGDVGAAVYLHLSRPGTWIDDATAAVARFDYRYDGDHAFVQTQLGFTLLWSEAELFAEEHLFHAVFGVGIRAGARLSVIGELTAVHLPVDDEVLFQSVDLGLRFVDRDVVLGLRVTAPTDESLRGSFGIGTDVRLRF